MRMTCRSAASSSWLTARMTAEKNGSSEKTRDGGSETTRAMESVRRVTRLRAAEFGM